MANLDRAVLLFTRKVPSRSESWTVEKSHYSLQDRHFRRPKARVTPSFTQNLG